MVALHEIVWECHVGANRLQVCLDIILEEMPIFTMAGRWKWGWSICCLLTQKQCHCWSYPIMGRPTTWWTLWCPRQLSALTFSAIASLATVFDDLPRPMPVCISACTYSSGSLRPVTSQHLIMLTTHLSLWSDVLEPNIAQLYSMLSTVFLSLIVISIVTWRA